MELSKWLKNSVLTNDKIIRFRVILGDTNARLHEIGILMDLASNLVVYYHVNSYNFQSINLKCNIYLSVRGN
jgi:DNA-directed RNA polymerase-4 subunit 1